MENAKTRGKRAVRERKRLARRRREKFAAQLGIDPAKVAGPWPGLPKVSDMLVAFAQPLLDTLPDDATIREIRGALMFSAVMWNSLVVADGDLTLASEELSELVVGAGRELELPEDELLGMLEQLAGRKRALFPDERRIIAGVEAKLQGDRVNVVALSSYPP
jgi:hypothetical protein